MIAQCLCTLLITLGFSWLRYHIVKLSATVAKAALFDMPSIVQLF